MQERPTLRLRGATVPGQGVRDVTIENGFIESVVPSAPPVAEEETSAPSVDLAGFVLLPAAVEPHAHLDRALLGARAPNETGDLAGAVTAIRAVSSSLTGADIRDRARRAVAIAVARGFTAIRTHTDCRSEMGVRGVRALLALRDELAEVIDLQVVAMAGGSISGSAGRENRRLLGAALDLGADVVGGAPAFDPDPRQAVHELVTAALDAPGGLDLHVDETTDRAVLTVRALATEVAGRGLGGRATASHCVSLGQQDPATGHEIATMLADAGISVVTLPQTNLYLQGRESQAGKPRGLTALQALHAAGVVVGGGGDNWRDPFNPLGRIDPFETAGLLVAAGHLPVEDAYRAVSSAPRQILGLAPVSVAAGHPAHLLAIRADSLGEAVADATEERLTIRAGTVLARTTVTRELTPELGPAT